jgi:DNA-binding response OmpR family regulator
VAILHVEDQEAIRELVRRALEAFGVSVLSVDGVSAAKLVLAERRDVTGALLDVRLRDGNGLHLYEWGRTATRRTATSRPALLRRSC